MLHEGSFPVIPWAPLGCARFAVKADEKKPVTVRGVVGRYLIIAIPTYIKGHKLQPVIESTIYEVVKTQYYLPHITLKTELIPLWSGGRRMGYAIHPYVVTTPGQLITRYRVPNQSVTFTTAQFTGKSK